jgi:TatD DNase family protein
MLIDTHAHLDFPEFVNDVDAVLARAGASDVQQIITIGIDLVSSRCAVELAQSHKELYATVGIHPHGAKLLDQNTLDDLQLLAKQERVVAIGEIGLDYYRDRQPRDIQRKCLRQQLELARALALPVVIHVREAYDDFLSVIEGFATSLVDVVLHCFSGNMKTAERCLALGFYLSIPGTVTFAKAHIQQQVAQLVPLDRLLLETDAPFLAPVPYRGKTNEPAYLIHTAQKIAELRELPLSDVARQTTLNAQQVFRLSSGG